MTTMPHLILTDTYGKVDFDGEGATLISLYPLIPAYPRRPIVGVRGVPV